MLTGCCVLMVTDACADVRFTACMLAQRGAMSPTVGRCLHGWPNAWEPGGGGGGYHHRLVLNSRISLLFMEAVLIKASLSQRTYCCCTQRTELHAN